jgi:hypothetical protein
MLVLYYFRRFMIYGPGFDSVRALLKSTLAGNFSEEQRRRRSYGYRTVLVIAAQSSRLPLAGIL